MKMSIAIVCAVLLSGSSASWAMTAAEILAAIDKNKNYTTITYSGVMEIRIGDEVRTKAMNVSGVGEQKAVVEFTNPEDEGVKYLKLDKELWIYFPSEQDVVKISGHLLKEGMMGSDVSYEDALESDAVNKKYSSSIAREEELDGKQCWVLQLDATVKDAPYFKRVMWVDKQLCIPLKEEMYAKSGKLLKVSHVLAVQKIGARQFPVKVEMVNMLRKNSKTTFEMKNIAFDQKLADDIFTMRYLRR
jgi:outer membrane lipoprotein-sorting protein